MAETKKLTVKNYLIGIGVLILACVGVWFGWMLADEIRASLAKPPKPTATVQPLIDQKQNMIDSLLLTVNRLITSTNQSKQSIIIQREGFDGNYQNALEHSPEVCLPTIKTMYRMARSMDSTNQVIIRRQDSTILNHSKVISGYSDIMALQKFQMQQKSDSIAQLQEQKKVDKRTDRRQKWKEAGKKALIAVFSFGTGYGTGKILP